MLQKGNLTIKIICALILWVQSFSYAHADLREYHLKAAYILNFVKFVYWPKDLFEEKNSPVNVCVLGKDPFGAALDVLTDKKVGSRAIVARKISEVQQSASCHVIFLSQSETKVIESHIGLLAGKHILTISDIEGFAGNGGMIGFIKVKNKIKFEINITSSNSSGIKFSSKLLELARVVK